MSIRPPILEIQHFRNLTLEIKGQGHWWGHSSKSQCGSSILSTHIPFVPSQSTLPFLRYSIFKIWPWKSRVMKIKGQGQMTMMLHNYKSRQFHRTSNGINLSSGFKDMGSAKCCLIWQVFGPWANPYGANGQITMTVHNYRSRQVHGTLNGVHPSSSFRDMRSAKSGPDLWQIW